MEPKRVAMWSGPRNVSTALMRAFSSRADTVCVDEPLYAAYLHETGIEHPEREEILRTYPTDWRAAVDLLGAPLPAGKSVHYQKHMTHHLLPTVERAWIERLENAFLIRNPREVLASYSRVIAEPTPKDLGLPQQVELFDRVRAQAGAPPPVVDAEDLLRDPEGILALLCARLGLEFDPAMLRWASGPHQTDGCWAPQWYANVWASAGFAPYRPKTEPLPARLEPLADRCRPYYAHLHEHRVGGK